MVRPIQWFTSAILKAYRFSDRIHCLVDNGIWGIIGVTDNDCFLGGYAGCNGG
jgi:hypothetical protein